MIDRIIGGLTAALTLYFLFDFFFWDGGILNPSILTRINDAAGVIAF